MRRPSVVRRLAAAAAITTLGAAAPITSPASADVDGSCRATVDGVSLAGRSASAPTAAIDVGPTDRVAIEVTGLPDDGTYDVGLEIAGVRYPVETGRVDDGEWSHELDVADGSWVTAGLVRLALVTESRGGSCVATALLDVEGSPTTTVVGGASIAGVFVGGVLLVWATVRARRRATRAVGLL